MGSQYFISDKCEDYGHICELNYNISVADNLVENKSYGNVMVFEVIVYICIMSLITHCFFKVDEKKIPDSDFKGYYILGCICSVYIIIVLLINYFTDQLEVCSYPRFCNEGLYDKIVETNFYYLKEECPKEYSWIVHEYNTEHDTECDDTEYGCCYISSEEISCSERSKVVFNVSSYSKYIEYVNQYHGKFNIGISKVDKEGTNCPSIEEVIYDYSAKEEDNYSLSLSLLGVSVISNFIVMALIFLCRFCHKKEYVKTRSFEASDIENKESDGVRGSA